MINRIPDAAINPDDVFEGDCFRRRELAEGFVKLLQSMPGPMTIALTAPYGGGKTWFLERCAHLLKASNVPVVKLNAWETDYAKEPLAPLISEFATAFESELSKSEQRLKQVKSAAVKVAAAAIPLAVRFATLGLLNLSDSTEGVLADAAQKIAEKRFDEFQASRAEITHLKKALGELADEMRSKRTKVEGAQRPPVVVLVDELDRCRPSYAIEMLEVIKHLFSIPGIVFVLGIDREQLSASAGAVFGQGLNADGYIRRFIDLECAMPEPDIAEYCESEGFKLMEKVFGSQRPQFQHVARATGTLCKAAGFSIRKTNQLITRIGVAVSQYPRNEYVAEAMAFMTFLQMWDSAL